MKINTCYTAVIKSQYITVKKDRKIQLAGTKKVDSDLMKKTSDICLNALTSCVDIVLKEWDAVSCIKDALVKKRTVDTMIHSTADNKAKYPQFDEDFKNMPSYVRRAIVADAIGVVSSHKSNHRN